MCYKEITSPSNETLKHVKKLLSSRDYREQCGEFVIEGQRIILDSFSFGCKIKKIIISESYDAGGLPEMENVSFYKVSDRLFKAVSDTSSPQGVMAVANMTDYNAEDVIKGTNPLVVLCEEITDPGNLGTIIRTSAAAGASAVLLTKGCVDLYNPKTIRSTMSALFGVPVVCGGESVYYINLLKERGISIVAGDLNGRKNYFSVDLTKPAAIIIGNEARGISAGTLELADFRVKIPMPGRAESLNAAVAASIIVYEAVRQRKID